MKPNKPIEYVILDFHGTLTDHNRRLTESIQKACEDAGLEESIAETIISKLSEQSGSSQDFLRQFIPKVKFPEFWKQFNYYRDMLFFPIDGLKETVQKLKDMGIQIVFLTNGTVTRSDYALHINEKSSYTNIIWNLLIEQWGIYSGKDDDVPFVISADDLVFISREKDFLPAEVFPPTGDRNIPRDEFIMKVIRENRRPSKIVKKPDQRIFEALGRIITVIVGKDFEPEKAVFVTDFPEDARLGIENRMLTMLFKKNIKQLNDIFQDEGPINANPIYPYFHIREIPFFCEYGTDLIRSVSFEPNGYIIMAEADNRSIYQIEVESTALMEPKFELHGNLNTKEYDYVNI